MQTAHTLALTPPPHMENQWLFCVLTMAVHVGQSLRRDQGHDIDERAVTKFALNKGHDEQLILLHRDARFPGPIL